MCAILFMYTDCQTEHVRTDGAHAAPTNIVLCTFWYIYVYIKCVVYVDSCVLYYMVCILCTQTYKI